MKNECAQPAVPARPVAPTLKSVWQVHANPSYIITRPLLAEAHIVIRTLAGSGRILLKNHAPLIAEAESILLLNQAELQQYRCAADHWRFFWFQFEPLSAPLLPSNRPLFLPDTPEEASERKKIVHEIRSPSSGSARIASARFGLMLCRWAGSIERAQATHPYQQPIERIIDEMKKRLGQNWTVPSMAVETGLGERRFRQVFQEITGHSPKEFYNRLRLEQARDLIENRLCNVSEAAEQLGFSSPFHLSKAFKKQFSCPPSKSVPRTPFP